MIITLLIFYSFQEVEVDGVDSRHKNQERCVVSPLWKKGNNNLESVFNRLQWLAAVCDVFTIPPNDP